MPVTVEVVAPYAHWTFEDTTLSAGEIHTLDEPSEGLLRALAGAQAAGVLSLGGDPVPGVETDEESLAFQDRAVAVRHSLLPERDAALAALDPGARAAHAAVTVYYQGGPEPDPETFEAAEPVQRILDDVEARVQATLEGETT